MDQKHIVPDETNEFFTEERCHILEIKNDREHRAYSLARARVEPGVTTAWHRLNGVEECYYILSGTGRMEIGEDFQSDVKSGDFIRIPPDHAQRISNIGDTDLVFLCYCSPAFGDECYELLE